MLTIYPHTHIQPIHNCRKIFLGRTTWNRSIAGRCCAVEKGLHYGYPTNAHRYIPLPETLQYFVQLHTLPLSSFASSLHRGSMLFPPLPPPPPDGGSGSAKLHTRTTVGSWYWAEGVQATGEEDAAHVGFSCTNKVFAWQALPYRGAPTPTLSCYDTHPPTYATQSHLQTPTTSSVPGVGDAPTAYREVSGVSELSLSPASTGPPRKTMRTCEENIPTTPRRQCVTAKLADVREHPGKKTTH